MRRWGRWWVWVALWGCVDPFPTVTGGQAPGDDLGLDRALADAARDAAPQVDQAVDAAPDMPPVVDAAPDMTPCRPTEETCNGVDDDCDTRIDEEQARQPCALTEGVCAGVTIGCVDGAFGECNYGLTVAEYEVVESECDGLDNDCDGDTDETCVCSPGETMPCGVDTGACQPGVLTCGDDGQFGDCMGQIGAERETCNGGDDDCDGVIDEETGGPCQTGELGQCAAGVQRCVAGILQCERENEPMVEMCNGADDNCNGVVDEGLDNAPCRTGQDGICGDGLTECTVDGLRCSPIVRPGERVEVCNGLDDDCDDVIDDLPPAACVTGNLGECAAGREVCVDGDLRCEQVRAAEPETCDGRDNDCDDLIDESVQSVACVPDGGAACGMGATRCEGGELICVAPAVGPDLCDGVDIDCDDRVDEDAVLGQQCVTGVDQCPVGVRACVDGVDTCTLVPNDEDDNGPDGIDDDCDGAIDEDLLVLYLEDLMMGGDGRRPGRPIGFIPGYPQRVVLGDGPIEQSPEPFIDRVFRPNAESPDGRGVQISSTGLRYDFSSDVGSTLSWTPPAKGPVEYVDNDANVPPAPGTFIIEMHANLGMTFDFDVIRARYPTRRIARLRGRVGSRARGETQLEVLMDGASIFKSNCLVRESRNRASFETLPRRAIGAERFLTLVAMDCDSGDIDARHGFFYDMRIELEPIDGAEDQRP